MFNHDTTFYTDGLFLDDPARSLIGSRRFTYQATVTRTKTWSSGEVLTAADLNSEFNNLLNGLALSNSDISAGAAIAYSKLNLTGSVVNADLAGSIDSTKISGTAVVLSGAQTLTGKKTFASTVQTITTDSDSSTITFNMDTSNIHTVTLGDNRTLAVSNVTSGQAFVIILKQDATGSRTVTWWSSIKWAGATVPTLTTTASRYDIFSFVYDGTNYYGAPVGYNFG